MKRRPKIKKRIKPRSIQEQQKKLIIFSVVVVFSGVLLFFLASFYTPKITLIYQGRKIGNSITINYKEKYHAPQYSAWYQNSNITKSVKVEGKVDNTRLGDYKIYYKTKKGIFRKVRILTVQVRDLSKPVIKLIGVRETSVCPGKAYKEEGFRAYDNFDGDLTERVKVKRVRDKIIYSVYDQAGNFREIVRTLKYRDVEVPVLKLKGSSYETVYLNSKFVDPGIEAYDNCDGAISNKVSITGKVDTSKVGSYELLYHVSDNASNKADIKRVVNVIEHGQNGTIYLTFDDGPKAGTTDVILDILKEENVKATFFITNQGPDELVAREAREGHAVALHTASHDYSYLYSSVNAYYEDLYAVHERVKRVTGQDAHIVRFPGGSSNTISRRYSPGIMSTLTKDVLEKGFRYYDWNLASGDAGEIYTADGIYENVTKKLSKDRVNIVLMHDIKPYTRDALRRIIQYGKENGYYFDKITEATEMMTQRVNN